MDFSLSSSLIGSAVLNSDKLSLDLQFAADKTLTARKGPTPTFTRASTATFVGSNGLIQSAAINAARFDHNPTSPFACRGLLIEESRTNLYQCSELFDDTFWNKTRLSITTNVTTAPDGTSTADKLVEDTTASNTHTLGSAVTPPATPHTLSVFAKKGERTWIVVRLGGTNTFFNLDDGTIAAGSVNAPTITNFGNGWYRCAVTSSLGTQGFFLLATNSTTTSYTGDGTSGLFLWGAQLEAGAFATSYIPTVASSVVRGADVCSIDGSNFASIWNGVDTTMFFRGSRIANQVGQTNWDLSSGTSATSIASDRGASTERIVANAVGIMTTPVFTTLTEYKIAAALRTSDYAVSFNGASAITSSSAFVLTLNRMTIGANRNNVNYLNGWIHSMKFYKKRLPNTKLQSFTA